MAVSFTVEQLAQRLGAVFEGDGNTTVSGVADLKLASATEVSFLAAQKFAEHLAHTQAGAVIVRLDCNVPEHLTVIRVADPYLAYAHLSGWFVTRRQAPPGVHPSATVHESALVADNARIGPNCVVDEGARVGANTELQAGVYVGQNVRIGEDCVLYANVSLYHDVSLGNEVTIHANTTIGSDGFGFSPSAEGWVKIHQLGSVIIGNNVEVGANCSIDRGAIVCTEIGDGVIIDNQVHIAHNVKVGRQTAIAGCVGIAGSTTIGERCTFGGQVAINGHITIADDVHVHGGAVVTKSLTEAGQYASGTPLQEVKLWRKNAVRQGQLSEWIERLKQLERTCEDRISDQ